MDKVENISGPINIVRVENKKMGKILYICMDVHMEFPNQRECDNVFTKDIKTFLLERFTELKKEDKTYDFFLEDFPDILKGNLRPFTGIYIGSLRKMMAKLFSINDNKIVNQNKKFPNIRFHYIDIRSNLNLYDDMFIKKPAISRKLWNVNCQSFSKDHIKIISHDIEEVIKEIDLFISIYTSDDKTTKINKKSIFVYNKDESEKINMIKYLVSKIKYKYNNREIGHTLNKIADNLIKYNKQKMDLYIKIAIKNLKIIEESFLSDVQLVEEYPNMYTYKSLDLHTKRLEELLKEINIHFGSAFEHFHDLHCLLVDIYFLRRFLDKDYITNSVVYTGALHSIFYILVLVKYFGFEITHTDIYKGKLEDINKIVINTDDKNYGSLAKYFWPATFSQCTNIENFPPIFK